MSLAQFCALECRGRVWRSVYCCCRPDRLLRTQSLNCKWQDTWERPTGLVNDLLTCNTRVAAHGCNHYSIGYVQDKIQKYKNKKRLLVISCLRAKFTPHTMTGMPKKKNKINRKYIYFTDVRVCISSSSSPSTSSSASLFRLTGKCFL